MEVIRVVSQAFIPDPVYTAPNPGRVADPEDTGQNPWYTGPDPGTPVVLLETLRREFICCPKGSRKKQVFS